MNEDVNRPRDPGASRLARMIERLATQRACLEWAAAEISGLDGPVIELGLGKGRTYDHLRRLMPNREIFCFDRDVHAPRDCVPDDKHLILGDFRVTLLDALERVGERAALIHADIGSEHPGRDAALVHDIGPFLADLIRPHGVLLADRELPADYWRPLPLPKGAGRWNYYVYRAP